MTNNDLTAKMLFKLPPEQAVEYMKNKGYKITTDWREMWEDAHAKAFTISKMTDATLLKESKEIIETAISEGWSSKKAEKELTNLYKKKQWWGKRIDVDSKGNAKVIQLGSPHRVRTIVRTNTQAAYSAQRYLRQLEDVDFAPYWEYVAVMDNKTRPSHAELHGKVFRYDDPFWDNFYPPNGFGCRCTVRNLTEHQLSRTGQKVEKSDGKITKEKINIGKADGDNSNLTLSDVKEVSVFTQDIGGNIIKTKTDAGWNYNVGKSAWNLDVMAYKEIAQLPQPVQDKFISEMALNRHREEFIKSLINKTLNKEFDKTVADLPLTWLTPAIIKTLKENNIRAITPIISFERRQVHHSLNPDIKVATQMLTPDQFKNIYKYLNKPDEVFYDIEKKQILYVVFLSEKETIDGRNCIKIPVIINSKNRKRPINYIGTTGRVNYDETFKNPNFIKIE